MPWYLCIKENGYNNVQHFKGAFYDYASNPNTTDFVAVTALSSASTIDSLTAGTVTASKAVVVDANKDIASFRHLTATGTVTAATATATAVTAGADGVAGTVTVYPVDSAKGTFQVTCTSQDGDTDVILTPAAMGQGTTISIPDPGASTANVVLTSAANDGVVVAATAAEINSAADLSAQAALITPSAVLTNFVGGKSVVQHGNQIETTFLIDLANLKSTTTANDIIGDTGVCYLMQVTAAVNGTIYAGEFGCYAVPVTGDPDIDLWAATAADGAYDADVSALAGASQLVATGGNHAIGTVKNMTALPAANSYLYLSVGSAGGAPGTYSDGILYVKLYGYVW